MFLKFDRRPPQAPEKAVLAFGDRARRFAWRGKLSARRSGLCVLNERRSYNCASPSDKLRTLSDLPLAGFLLRVTEDGDLYVIDDYVQAHSLASLTRGTWVGRGV